MSDKISYEVYTLTLRHEYEFGNGKRIQITDPLVIKYMSMDNHIGSTVCLNEMMEKLKAELLRMANNDRGKA